MRDRTPDMFNQVVGKFANRVTDRDVLGKLEVPEEDTDIIDFAEEKGLTEPRILEASLVARRRVGMHVNLELVDVDTHAFAEQKKRHINLN